MQISKSQFKIKNLIIFGLVSLIFTPRFIFGADVIVNNQSVYAVPPGTSKVLILDLTLPENLTSIKILNEGSVQQWDISALSIFEDGSSLGWDGDELEIARRSSSPFWDNEIFITSSKPRIFVAVDIASTALSGRTVKPKAIINSDSAKTAAGFERTILAGTSEPIAPSAPLSEKGEALSASAIRWYFRDSANNEFGFKIKDSSLKTTVKAESANLLYLDETGLRPSTCYSGRRAFAYNDRGESPQSAIFAEVCTLSAATPTPAPTVILTPTPVPTTAEVSEIDNLKAQIIEIQQKIVELLAQLIQLLQGQIEAAQASLYNAFEIFSSWVESRFQ